MEITLLSNTQLYIAAKAIRNCHATQDKSDSLKEYCTRCKADITDRFITQFPDGMGDCPDCNAPIYPKYETTGDKDRALIDRVGNKMKHASTLEHLVYTFQIDGISRAVLQELARHRIASLTVKSTRYTLKELKDEESFVAFDNDKNLLHSSPEQIERAKEYLVFTGILEVDMASVSALDYLSRVLKSGISNDKAKYCLPESYKTSLTWTINARSLQNFLSLRTDKSALWEIRDLARAIFDKIPDDHKYLFEDHIKE